jgi:cyclase
MVVPELVREPRAVLPTIVFDDRLIVHVGGTAVELIHVGGHCADLTVAYVPSRRVLFASDDVVNGKEAYVGDGDLVTWIDALRRLRERPVELVVPGHGPVGGPELLEAQIQQLEGLLANALRGDA